MVHIGSVVSSAKDAAVSVSTVSWTTSVLESRDTPTERTTFGDRYGMVVVGINADERTNEKRKRKMLFRSLVQAHSMRL